MTHTKDEDVLYKTASNYPKRPYQLDGFGWLSPKTRTITVKNGVHVEMTWDIEEKNCDVVLSPAAQPAPVPLTDEQAEFESVFKLPSNCTKFQGGYAPTSHNAWEAQTFCARWEGWKARSAHGITKGQP